MRPYLACLDPHYIDRNIVMRSSGFDDDWTLLLVANEVLSNVSYPHALEKKLSVGFHNIWAWLPSL